MIRFLTWLRSLLFSVLNAIAKMAVFVVLVVAALLVFSLAYGDGLPGNMVLSLDLREPVDDSSAAAGSIFTPRRATVMDVVLGLDAASALGGWIGRIVLARLGWARKAHQNASLRAVVADRSGRRIAWPSVST